MGILSIEFLLLATLTVTLTQVLPGTRARIGVLTVANAVFLGSYVASPLALLPFVGFLGAMYAAILVAKHLQSRAAFLSVLFALIVVFAYLRKYAFVAFVPELPFAYLMVGMSYILFRSLQLFIDARNPEEPVPGLLTYFNYTCTFLALVSGPIQRFEDYKAQEDSLGDHALTRGAALSALSRIGTGLVRLTVLSSIPLAAHQMFLPRSYGQVFGVALPTPILLFCGAFSALAYAIYLYQNFAGYMDVVVGLGKLIGFDLPENFDRPLATKSILDFWTKWHISLSDWFKFYLFNPVVAALMHRDPDPKKREYYGVIGFFVAFLVIGIWHGSTMIFVLYGFLLGLGVSVNKLWQVRMRKRLGKKGYKALQARPTYALACHAFNIGYFAFALICFWMKGEVMLKYVDSFGVLGVLLVLPAATLICLAVIGSWRLVQGLFGRLVRPDARAASSPQRAYAWASAKLVLGAIFLAAHIGDAPVFVYQDF